MDYATGAMGGLLSKLGMLLKEEYDLQKSVKGGIKFLMAELESMQVALEEVYGVPADQVDKETRLWARDVREMSYDIEDSLDTFLVRVEGKKKPDKPHGLIGFIERSLNSLSKTKIRHRLATNIENIKGRVKEAKERRDRYNVGKIVVKPEATSSSIDPRLAAMYKKATELVGIDKARDELISMLSHGIGDSDLSWKRLKIVSVVGFGGLGKTTLAKTVYERVNKDFKCTALVSVGQNPDIKKVLKDILLELDHQVFKDIHNTIRDGKQLIDLLRRYLDDKRYFIVIDDIWDINSWDTIKLSLVENNCGSKIIITTRNLEVGTEAGDVYKLQPLSHDNSRKLFCTRIFGGEDKCTEHQFGAALDKILKKCGGVPLAIVTMASLLAGKQMDEWFEVYSFIGFTYEDNRHVDNTMRILSFSYYDMPCHLRTCLLYLSVFPEDTLIYKDPLIWMWVAEGFIPRVQGVGLFDLGEKYFNQLLSRSMIEPEEEYGCLVGCRLHDMVLSLIRSFSREEHFVTIFDNEQDRLSQGNLRRLCYQHRDPKVLMDMDMAHVRTVVAYSCDISKMAPLSSFQVLRVLALEGCHLTDGCSLTNLGDLVHLRYLGLNNTNIAELPEEIGDLKFLQTLDLDRSQVAVLPLSIVRLTQLVCLRGSYQMTRLPADEIVGKLTSLEQLINVQQPTVGDCSRNNMPARQFVRELGKLTELRVLEKIWIGALDEGDEVLMQSLRNLRKLSYLEIYCNSIWTAEEGWERRVLRWEAPGFLLPRHLRHFEFKSFVFPSLPTFISSSLLPNISYLSIRVEYMDCKDMRILGNLPELSCLFLWTNCDLVLYGGDDLFPKLRQCHVDPGDDGTTVFRRGSCGELVMPNLEYLSLLCNVKNLKNDVVRHGQSISCFLPTLIGLHNVPSLNKFFARIDCSNVTWSDVDETTKTLDEAATALPNHPNVRTKLWDDTTDDIIADDEDQQHSKDNCKVFDFHVYVRKLNDMCYAFDFTNLRDFPSLEKVIAHINCGDAIPEEVAIAEEALRCAVYNHPSKPTLEVERYSEDTMKLVCDQDQHHAKHGAAAEDKIMAQSLPASLTEDQEVICHKDG